MQPGFDRPKENGCRDPRSTNNYLQKEQRNEYFDKNEGEQLNLISGPLMMSRKINEYVNEVIIRKLKEFAQIYPLCREVRGDGNCFYRAVFFLYIENLLDLKKTQPKMVETRWAAMKAAANDLQRSVNQCTIPQEFQGAYRRMSGVFTDGLDKLRTQIDMCENISITQKIEKFEEFLNENKDFDFTSIVLLRCFALKALVDFAPHLQPYYLGNEEQLIKDFSVEGQNVIINLLVEYLGIPIQIETILQNSVNSLLNKPQFAGKQDYEFPTLTLFFRPGHYDICYSLKHAKDIYLYNPEQCFVCSNDIVALINEMCICKYCNLLFVQKRAKLDICKLCSIPIHGSQDRYSVLCSACQSKCFILSKAHFQSKSEPIAKNKGCLASICEIFKPKQATVKKQDDILSKNKEAFQSEKHKKKADLRCVLCFEVVQEIPKSDSVNCERHFVCRNCSENIPPSKNTESSKKICTCNQSIQ